jgi:histidine decarboxylase
VPADDGLSSAMGAAAGDIVSVLSSIRGDLQSKFSRTIGFPGATDIDFSPVMSLGKYLINNIGDPEIPGAEPRNTKHIEVGVIDLLVNMLGGSSDDWWGYASSGSTESNLYGLYLGRERFPEGTVFYSAAAHYSVEKAARLLRLPTVVVPVDHTGQMRYDALANAAACRPSQPPIVVTTLGTTMTEAIDKPALVHEALSQAGHREWHIHADAALSGIPLALSKDYRHIANLAGPHPPDSFCLSGHKFFGTPLPCGVALARRLHVERVRRHIGYIAGPDTTISGSRSGLAPLLLWYALRRYGVAGHSARADSSRALAAYALERLQTIGWSAWRHEHAFTVVLRAPARAVRDYWSLPTEHGWSHIVCMPGVRQDEVEALVGDIERSRDRAIGVAS